MYRKTPVAARELLLPLTTLQAMIRDGRIDPLPAKDTSGDYLWSDDDLARAREVLKKGRRKRRDRSIHEQEAAHVA